MKFIIILCFIVFSLPIGADDKYSFIEECPLPYSVMLSIANVEKAKGYNAGYPYMVSFNSSSDYFAMQEYIHNNKLKDLNNQRNVDCISREQCINFIEFANEKNITNIDIGAFQINQHFHKIDIDSFFVLEKSYVYACSYIVKLSKEYQKLDWETIAMYHSKSKEHNQKYKNLLFKELEKLNEEIK